MILCQAAPGHLAVFSAGAFLALAFLISGCADRSSSRVTRQPAHVDSAPPLLPLPEDAALPSPPPPASMPAPLFPLAGQGTSGQLIAPRQWPENKPLAASRPTTAPARPTIFAAGNLEAGGKISGWHFVFAQGGPEGLEQAEVLPNNLLEQMIGIVGAAKDGPVLFHITAELTRYKQQQYLLIRGTQYEGPQQPGAEDRP